VVNYEGRQAYASAPKGEYREQTTPVGSFKVANVFGLFDMHGNVDEWCFDHWHENYENAPEDGLFWINKVNDNDNHFRLLRGGSWDSYPDFCRSANRYRDNPGIAFNDIGSGLCAVSRRSNFFTLYTFYLFSLSSFFSFCCRRQLDFFASCTTIYSIRETLSFVKGHLSGKV
jgi:Sulfatase-modifying factor enzyme 1